MSSVEESTTSVSRVRTALEELHGALRRALGESGCGDPVRGVDLVNKLGVDLKLAWKIARILNSKEPFESVRYLPGPEGLRIFAVALKSCGASEGAIAPLLAAYERVKEVGKLWGGDARAFELMAAGIARQGDPRVDLDQRKALFLSGSYVWGIRAKAILRLDLLHPSRDGANVEMLTARGFHGVERLRMDAPWYLEVPFCVDDAGSGALDVNFEPLDLDDRGSGAPFFWKRFCSRDLPQLRPPQLERVPRVVELPIGAVGVECRFNLVHGAMVRGKMPARRAPGSDVAISMLKVQTPCETAVMDYWVHRDLVHVQWPPTGAMYSVLDGWRGQFSHQNRDRLPIEYEIREIGHGKASLKADGIEVLPELVDAAFARTGWKRQEFRHVRIEIVYPPVPATMTLELPLLP